uniref:Uncharacterized protein n=1 Tax=Anopheles atroparvus TaxID=41427 RepID=A0A182IZC9_ANOAO
MASSSSSRRESRRSGTTSQSLSATASSSSALRQTTSTSATSVNSSASSSLQVLAGSPRYQARMSLAGRSCDDTSPTTYRETPRRHFLACINDIFKCTICFGELDQPHLCPRCSKMYCYDCIDEWLLTGASQCCPNCKLDLHLDQLVKVRWFDDIEKLQRNLRSLAGSGAASLSTTAANQAKPVSDAEQELCLRHGKALSFYCSSCKQCVCETCATDADDSRHRDHTFKALHVTYEQHRAVLEGELEKVEHYRDKLAALVDNIDRNVELIGRVKAVKCSELESIVAAARRGLDRQEEQKVTRLHEHRHVIAGEMDAIEEKLQAMRCDMDNSARSQLIQMKSTIVDTCNAIRAQPIQDFKHIRVSASLNMEFPAIFETGIFVVQNFSTFDDNKVVYSSEFSDCLGRIWRIMAFCGISEDHFGLYLELVHGLPCWMECTFQLIHDDPRKTISKTIREYFDRTPKKGWGLRDFVSLSTIVEEQYLRDNDSLELLYHIRPCNADDTEHALDGDDSMVSED